MFKFSTYFILSVFPIFSLAQNPVEDFVRFYQNGEYSKACNIGILYLSVAKDGITDPMETQQMMFGYVPYACYMADDMESAAEGASYVVDWVKYHGHESDPTVVSAHYAYATYLGYAARYDEAFRAQEKASAIAKEIGSDELTLQMQMAKAGLYHQAGSFHLAKEEYTLLYKNAQLLLKPTDSLYQVITNTTSAFYTMQGYFADAEIFFLQACESMKNVYGLNSAQYLASANSTGEFYIYAGWYAHAENQFREMLPVTAKVFGKKSADYATNLNNLAVALEKQEKYTEALKVYDECLKLKAKVWKKESDYYALTLTNIAVVYHALGQVEKAKSTLQEAIVIYERISYADPVNYAMTLNNTAYTYSDLADFSQAFSLQLKAMEVMEKAHGRQSKEYAGMEANLAMMASRAGKYDLAMRHFEQASETQKKLLGANHPEYGTTIYNMANLLIEQGQYRFAQDYLEEALRVHQKSNGVPNALLSMAGLKMNLGLFQQSENLYAQAIEEVRLRLGNKHPEYATAISNRALLYIETGRYEAAIEELKQAERLIIDAYGKDHYELAYVYANMSNANRYSGNFKEAEQFAMHGIEITKNSLGLNHPDYGTALQNLAVMYYEFGSYIKAEETYNQALEVYLKSFPHNHPLVLSLYSNKGAMYMAALEQAKTDEQRQKTFDAASEALEFVVSQYGIENEHIQGLIVSPNLPPDAAIHINNLAELHRITGDFVRARGLYQIALEAEIKNFGELHERVAVSLSNMALLKSAMGQHLDAIEMAERALQIRENRFGGASANNTIAWHGLASIYEKAGEILKADSAHQMAVELTFSTIDRNFAFMSRAQRTDFLRTSEEMVMAYGTFVLTHGTQHPESVGRMWNYTARHKGILLRSDATFTARVAEEAKRNPEIKSKYAQYRKMGEVIMNDEGDDVNYDAFAALEKQLLAALGEAVNPPAPNYKQFMASLPAKSAHIEILRIEHDDKTSYAAILLKKDAQPEWISLTDEASVKQIIESAVGDDRTRVNALYGISENGKMLYSMLWKPISDKLAGVTQVSLNPAGVYHQIPLHALFDESKRSPEDQVVLRLTNSVDVLFVQAPVKPKSAHVLGGARYTQKSAENFWQYLPGTLSEALDVTDILAKRGVKVQLDTGFLATESRLREAAALGGISIWHLATHGFFYPNPKLQQNIVVELDEQVDMAFRGGGRGMYGYSSNRDPMMRSGVVFAGVNDALSSENVLKFSNGVLTAAEVEWIPLRGAELVVLSACETGLGDISGNEGVYGLQRAFRIAGAKKLIMSLWQVPDNETREFFGHFYNSYAKSGDASEAMRNARLIMGKKYDPYYWAAFILVE